MDRFLTACFVVLVCNLIVLAKASYDIDYHKLYEFEEALHRVANEKKFLRERTASVLELKADLDDSLNALNNGRDGIRNQLEGESGALDDVIARIKLILHRLGDLEAKVAGQMAVSARNQKILAPTWEEINQLASGSNVKQSAKLANGWDTLEQNAKKVGVTLNVRTKESLDAIMSAQKSRSQFTRKVNTKKCFSKSASLAFDTETGVAVTNVTIPIDFFPNGAFAGESVPSVLCGVEAVVSDLQLDDKKGDGYGYGSKDDEPQSTAITVDCQPFFDRVEIKAFDQSRGHGNGLTEAYVGIRACSFAALAGFSVNA